MQAQRMHTPKASALSSKGPGFGSFTLFQIPNGELRLNHYTSKSAEEWNEKKARGRADRASTDAWQIRFGPPPPSYSEEVDLRGPVTVLAICDYYARLTLRSRPRAALDDHGIRDVPRKEEEEPPGGMMAAGRWVAHSSSSGGDDDGDGGEAKASTHEEAEAAESLRRAGGPTNRRGECAAVEVAP